MTAEVAVLNRSAAALAADSAVTFGSGKIYNTISKLFTLSKYEPVGIMVYNNANYMGVPWETIIKIFRHELGSESLQTIDDYVSRFLEFLDDSRFCTPDGEIDSTLDAHRQICDVICSEATNILHSNGGGKLKRDKNSAIETSLNNIIAALEKKDPWNHSNPFKFSDVVEGLEDHLSAIERQIFDSYQLPFKKAFVRKIRKCLRLTIFADFVLQNYSGICIAGFGKSEIFPSLVACKLEGRFKGNTKVVTEPPVRVGTHNTSTHTKSYIRGFAQTDMVERFMSGVDSEFEKYLITYFKNVLLSFADDITKSVFPDESAEQNELRSLLYKASDKHMSDLRADLNSYVGREFHTPILDVVQGMPKADLSSLAEALVSLTSTKRRMSSDKDTVGGPIDVALISKDDGFIWVKRKHYFDVKFNPSFVQNYLRQDPHKS